MRAADPIAATRPSRRPRPTASADHSADPPSCPTRTGGISRSRRPSYAASSLHKGEGGAHQVDEVVAVETLLEILGHALEAALEAADWVPATLHMRIVGREQAHLRTRLLDDPPGIFGRIGRDPDLPAHEVTGPQRQLLQPLLVLGEGVLG